MPCSLDEAFPNRSRLDTIINAIDSNQQKNNNVSENINTNNVNTNNVNTNRLPNYDELLYQILYLLTKKQNENIYTFRDVILYMLISGLFVMFLMLCIIILIK
jgi:hypothetical protein